MNSAKNPCTCEACSSANTQILGNMLANINHKIAVLNIKLTNNMLIFKDIQKTMYQFHLNQQEISLEMVQAMDISLHCLEELTTGLGQNSKSLYYVHQHMKLVEEGLAKANGQEVEKEDPINVALEYMDKQVDATLNRIVKWKQDEDVIMEG